MIPPLAAVSLSALHATSKAIEQQPTQQIVMLEVAAARPADTVGGEPGMNVGKDRFRCDSIMLACEVLIPVADLTNVDPVAKKMSQTPSRSKDAAPGPALLTPTCLSGNAIAVERLDGSHDRAKLKIPSEDQPYRRSFGVVDHQLAIDDIIAKRHRASHPYAFALGRGDLVPNALAGDFTLEHGYRYAAKKIFPATDWTVDFDHSFGRTIARQLDFRLVLLLRIVPSVNRGHGAYERTVLLSGLNIHKLCFADRRILDKWIGRPPKFWNDPVRLLPYRLDRRDSLGLTLKQAGKWGFAMGVEDDPLPLSNLQPLR